MNRIEERIGVNNGVRLHYLTSGDSEELTPLIYQPGFLSDAETFRDEMELLAPRKVISLGRRGIGSSDAPMSGYSFEDQLADMRTMITSARDDSSIDRFCLMAFSAGVPLAIAYAGTFPDEIAGLILIDYPPVYPEVGAEWLQQVSGLQSGIPDHVLRQMQSESRRVVVADHLQSITAPALILRGDKWSALTANGLEGYLHFLPNGRGLCFEGAGHEIFRDDYDRFVREVVGFLGEVDGRSKE